MSPEKRAIEEHECHPEAASDSGQSSSSDESPDLATELNHHLLSLKRTIDNLYKLSFMIRNSRSRQSTLQKAESYGMNFNGDGGDLFQHLQPGHHDRAACFIRQLREDSGCANPRTLRNTMRPFLIILPRRALSAKDNSLIGNITAINFPRRRLPITRRWGKLKVF